MRCRSTVVMAGGVAAAMVLAGCGSTASAGGGAGGSRTLRVVAAENFWGSVAAQVGGSHVQVHSIIDNPDADPHDYEPTAADGRAIASADVVLINGIGYDSWASKLVEANPAQGRIVLTVGTLIGVPDGGNPHRWYNPADVQRVADQLVADYGQADPADAAAFSAQGAEFEHTALARYLSLIAKIKSRYAGTPVGASESIFAMLAPALGLELVTPPSFLKAISQGIDPGADDKATIDQQIADRRIKVYVYNDQNATPDIQAQISAAKAAGIPIATISETMVPATVSWQDWQLRQLEALRAALAEGTGR